MQDDAIKVGSSGKVTLRILKLEGKKEGKVQPPEEEVAGSGTVKIKSARWDLWLMLDMWSRSTG